MAGEATLHERYVFNQKIFEIKKATINGTAIYYCGILPGRLSLDKLKEDIRKSQGPEWRK